jgi:O-antigen/teichoic acid export membrane protein
MKDYLIPRLIWSAASNYAGKFVSLGTWFIITPIILHKLGASQYGLWVLVGSVVAYGSMLDFGIASAVTKYVAEYRAKGELKPARAIISTALLIYVALGSLVVLLGVLFAPVFPDVFNVNPQDRDLASRLVILSTVALGASIPCATAPAVLRGLHRFDLLNLVGIVGSVLSGAGTVAVLQMGAGVTGVVCVGLVVTILMQVPSLWFVRRVAPELDFSLCGTRRSTARAITSFSYLLFLIHVGGLLETKTDEIVIGRFLPLNAVTPYNLARRLSNLPQLLAEQFLILLLPLASELDAADEQDRLRSLHIVSTRLTLAVILPFACSLAMLAGPILYAWLGPEYARYGLLVMILTLASVIDTSIWPAGRILQGMARHAYTAVAAISSGFANLALSLALVRLWGLTGVALGTVIPTAVVCLGFVMPYSMRVIGTEGRKMLMEAYLPALLPAIPTLIILYVVQRAFQPQSWPALFLVGGIGLLTYFAGYLSSTSSSMERRLACSLAMKTLRMAGLHRQRQP